MAKEIRESIARPKQAPFLQSFYESSFYKAIVITLIAAVASELRIQIENENSALHKHLKFFSSLEKLHIHHKVLFTVLITFLAAIIVLFTIFTVHFIFGKVIKLGESYITPFY